MNLGIAKPISEFRTGFESSQWNFGALKWIWEFATELRSSETDLGTPNRFSESGNGFS